MPRRTLDVIARFPAVQLFVARAQAVAPAFPLTAASAALVARICTRLDGIPLALELAAAWVRVLTLDQILAHLDDSLRLLVGGSRVAPTRQQTLRAALDWSDALLTDAERALFQRLAVFGGEFTLEAVEAVCADETLLVADLLALLARLVDSSFVAVTMGEGSTWYRLLEPVRQYALHGLHGARRSRGDTRAARRVLPRVSGAGGTGAARAGARRLAGAPGAGAGQSARGTQLGAGDGSVGDRDTAGDGAGAFLGGARSPRGGAELVAHALAAPTDGMLPTWRMRALAGAGRLAHFHAAYAEAERLHSESLAHARELEDAQGIAAALTELGMAARRLHDYPRSVALIEEGLARSGN